MPTILAKAIARVASAVVLIRRGFRSLSTKNFTSIGNH
jgi:hypothetical protein